jgi:hypothetical protein
MIVDDLVRKFVQRGFLGFVIHSAKRGVIFQRTVLVSGLEKYRFHRDRVARRLGS